MIKDKHPHPTAPDPQAQNDSGLAVVSMVLGVISLTGPGLILGIPAIVTASIALKKNLGGRGLSIAGLVTGIISTVLSVLFLSFLAFLIVWGVNHPGEFDQQYLFPQQNVEPYESSST